MTIVNLDGSQQPQVNPAVAEFLDALCDREGCPSGDSLATASFLMSVQCVIHGLHFDMDVDLFPADRVVGEIIQLSRPFAVRAVDGCAAFSIVVEAHRQRWGV
jgi:hypothetical protein